MKKPTGSPIASSILSDKIKNNSSNNERGLKRMKSHIDFDAILNLMFYRIHVKMRAVASSLYGHQINCCPQKTSIRLESDTRFLKRCA